MERLIENVRKYPCLWKLDCEEYKLNDLKETAWIEVAKECDLVNAAEARSLWKKLRDGHRQALARKKTMSGQAATSKQPWKYEKQMDFLLPIMQNRQRFTNISSSPTQNSDQGEPQCTEDSYDSELDHSYGESSRPKKKPTLLSVMENEQKMRAERSAQRYDLRKELLLSYKDNVPKQTTALESFFTSMCMTTQTLPEALQLKVQRQLFNIVMEAKEEYLNQKSLNQSRNFERTESTVVHSFRGDSPFHLPIDNTSRSHSATSNYLTTDPSQDCNPLEQSLVVTEQQNISDDASLTYGIRSYLEQTNFD